MPDLLNVTLGKIRERNPAYADKLERQFQALDDTFFARAEELIGNFDRFLRSRGRDLDYGIDCHLKLCDSMVQHRIDFMRTGAYANRSFEEVRRSVYANPGIFEYHMFGLVLAQIFWHEQYARYCFFADHLPAYRDRIRSYMEVGGGHAWYVTTAVKLLEPGTRFDLLDISETSIELAKGLSPNDRVSYILADIQELPPTRRYDFISIGEVIEHLEQPLAMLQKIRDMLTADGRAFISTPTNSPTVDHIYLFNNAQEIRDLFAVAGFEITAEATRYSEDLPERKAIKYKTAQMFAAFVRKQPQYRTAE
jgi:SAM-dependent methyltransferase